MADYAVVHRRPGPQLPQLPQYDTCGSVPSVGCERRLPDARSSSRGPHNAGTARSDRRSNSRQTAQAPLGQRSTGGTGWCRDLLDPRRRALPAARVPRRDQRARRGRSPRRSSAGCVLRVAVGVPSVWSPSRRRRAGQRTGCAGMCWARPRRSRIIDGATLVIRSRSRYIRDHGLAIDQRAPQR